MAKFSEKLKGFLFTDEPEDDTIYDDDTYEQYEDERNTGSSSRSRGKDSGNVVRLQPSSNGPKVIIFKPTHYEDAETIVDNLKSRKPVVVNMVGLTAADAQRILDILSGAVYALSGKLAKISNGIFIVAPTNVDVIGAAYCEDEED